MKGVGRPGPHVIERKLQKMRLPVSTAGRWDSCEQPVSTCDGLQLEGFGFWYQREQNMRGPEQRALGWKGAEHRLAVSPLLYPLQY